MWYRPLTASRALLAAALWVLFASAAGAAGVAWENLSDAQRALLSGMQSQWPTLPPERQERLARGAERWQRMDAAGRDAAQSNLRQWRGMSPQAQAAVRERFERFRQLPPQRQQELRKRFQWYKTLPDGQRRELRQRWLSQHPQVQERLRRMSPAERGALQEELRAAPPQRRAELLRERLGVENGAWSGDMNERLRGAVRAQQMPQSREARREWYRSLAPDEQARLREQWRQMSRRERWRVLQSAPPAPSGDGSEPQSGTR